MRNDALPLFAKPARATELYDISKSELYRLLAAEKIRAVKAGRTTLIDMQSVRDYLASLPAAKISLKAA